MSDHYERLAGLCRAWADLYRGVRNPVWRKYMGESLRYARLAAAARRRGQ